TWRQISALLLLFLMPLLSGCAQQQKPPVEYRVIKQPVLNLPAELTSRIDVPDLPDNPSYGDSVSMNATLYGIVGQCNIDRAAIRKLQVTGKETHP
ncbi:Rz1-like lysis system protein LysC, partial [Enterobacter hormaechei]